MARTPIPVDPERKPHIKLGPQRGIYRMSSKSKPGTRPVVDVRHGTCTCDAGQHGRPCYHLRYCRQYDAALTRARARAMRPVGRPAFVLTPPVASGEGMRALLECFA